MPQAAQKKSKSAPTALGAGPGCQTHVLDALWPRKAAHSEGDLWSGSASRVRTAKAVLAQLALHNPRALEPRTLSHAPVRGVAWALALDWCKQRRQRSGRSTSPASPPAVRLPLRSCSCTAAHLALGCLGRAGIVGQGGRRSCRRAHRRHRRPAVALPAGLKRSGHRKVSCSQPRLPASAAGPSPEVLVACDIARQTAPR